MDDDATFARCADLRRETADLLDSLTPEQLTTPSLCGKWDVLTVAAHLIVLSTVTIPAFAVTMLRSRGNFDAANDAMARKAARGGAAEVARTLRDRATSRATPPGAGPIAPLTDLLVHGADMRIPLGIAGDLQPTDLAAALAFVSGGPRGFSSKRRVEGIRIAPSDLDQTWGTGAELTGPAIDVLIALCGRRVALDRLAGPGKDLLAARI